MKDSGIYQILNIVNQKCYIGSSQCIRKRIYHHKYKLKFNSHANIHLQSSWNKHGGINFIFRTLETLINPTQVQLEERENYWIDYYNSTNPNKGYNKQQADRGTFTDEWKLKRKEVQSKQQTKEYFLKLKMLEDISLENKELIIENLLKYTSDKKCIKLVRNINILKIHISNPKENFEKKVFVLLDPLKVISQEEYNNLLKGEVIYQIQPDSNQIVKKFEQIQNVLLEYPQIKRKQLERLLYSKDKKAKYSSVHNMIFVLESKYQPNKIYSIRQRKEIIKIDKQGNILKQYGNPNHIIKENPNLSLLTLRTILADNSPSELYPFKYSDTEPKEIRKSTIKSDSTIYEINNEGNIIKEFPNTKSVIQEYPLITPKGLQKVLYENSKSTKGHFFVLKRNYPKN